MSRLFRTKDFNFFKKFKREFVIGLFICSPMLTMLGRLENFPIDAKIGLLWVVFERYVRSLCVFKFLTRVMVLKIFCKFFTTSVSLEMASPLSKSSGPPILLFTKTWEIQIFHN